MTDWHELANELADLLSDSEALRSPAWRDAFISVPRHHFAPEYYRNEGGSPTLWKLFKSTDGDEWLSQIYTNRSLVTALDPNTLKKVEGGWNGNPTSSSTQPSLMARMLEYSNMNPDHSVLEVGTGTGYNAALISSFLENPATLTSVDINEQLVASARQRNRALGLLPEIHVQDISTEDWSESSYDRILATCALKDLTVFVDALRPGGRIVVNAMPPLNLGLIALDKINESTLEGSFHPDGGSFMPLRYDPSSYPEESENGVLAKVAEGSATVPISAIDRYDFQFLLSAFLPGVSLQYGLENGSSTRRLSLSDGAYAEARYPDNGDSPSYIAYGASNIWEIVAESWKWFVENDEPEWETFGLTVNKSEHHFWYESPNNVLTRF